MGRQISEKKTLDSSPLRFVRSTMRPTERISQPNICDVRCSRSFIYTNDIGQVVRWYEPRLDAARNTKPAIFFHHKNKSLEWNQFINVCLRIIFVFFVSFCDASDWVTHNPVWRAPSMWWVCVFAAWPTMRHCRWSTMCHSAWAFGKRPGSGSPNSNQCIWTNIETRDRVACNAEGFVAIARCGRSEIIITFIVPLFFHISPLNRFELWMDRALWTTTSTLHWWAAERWWNRKSWTYTNACTTHNKFDALSRG